MLPQLPEWIRRLLPGRSDRDLQDELRSHLAFAEEDAQRRSHGDGDSTRAARLRAGGVTQAMDAMRDQRRLPWLDDLRADFRFGLRTLRRSPGYTLVALATLAIGIGANTAAFSIVNGVLLEPLPYAAPERLVHVGTEIGGAESGLSYPEYDEYRAMTRSFAQLGAFTSGRNNVGGGAGVWSGAVNLSAGGQARSVRAVGVDHHLLAVLGVRPAHGRFFGPGETDAMPARPGLGGPALAVLSYELWRDAFAGQPVVGTLVPIDGRSYEIIGILPEGIDLAGQRPDVWLPLGVHPQIRRIRTRHSLSIVGRLRDGVSLDQARVELASIQNNWAEQNGVAGHAPVNAPSRPQDHSIRLEPLQEAVVGDASRPIWLLQGAVGLALFLGCVNLASLALARADARRRELAIRTALGAGRGRLIRQLIAEGLILSTVGGLLGLALAHAGLRWILTMYPEALPRATDFRISPLVLGFSLLVSFIVGLLFGLVPTLQVQARNLIDAIKRGGDRGTSRSQRRSRGVLVAAEVALAVMLVTAGGLLVRTVHNLSRVNPGFDRSNLVTFSLTVPAESTHAGSRAQIFQQVLDTLRATPGIDRATAMSQLPFDRHVQRFPTQFQDDSGGDPVTATVGFYQFVMSDYFATMGIPLLDGRTFGPPDATSEDRVVVVSASFAARFWNGQHAIGRRIRPNLSASMGTASNPWHTVIGVVGDVAQTGVNHAPESELYILIDQPAPPIDGTTRPWVRNAPVAMHVALRTTLTPNTLTETVEGAVPPVEPAVPVVGLRDMETVFRRSIARQRLLSQLLAGFGGLGLLLAATGTYGVLAYSVSERRREIGVRLALGARRSAVVRMMLGQGLTPAGFGLVAGVVGALAVGRWMGALLYGIGPTSPSMLLGVAVALGVVVALACLIPAVRAASLDPIETLRPD